MGSTPTTEQGLSSSLHACEVHVTFPTNLQADQAVCVMQVDSEPTVRVNKSFRLGQVEDAGESKVSMVV